MWKLAALAAALVVAVLIAVESNPSSLTAFGEDFSGTCVEPASLELTFNDEMNPHPVLWSGPGNWQIDISYDPATDAISILGPDPIIPVAGTVDAQGVVEATGEGTYAEIQTTVDFVGELQGEPKEPVKLLGEYIVGPQQELPGGLPINYGLNCQIPPPEKSYSVTVLKLDADTNDPLAGFEFNLFKGDCSSSDFIDFGFTGADGTVEFSGLQPNLYSIDEKPVPGWNVEPAENGCQEFNLPSTAGGPAGALPSCPIQNNPFPEAGCDEFNSAASVLVEFTNPPSTTLNCDLGGPTQIQRSAVNGDTFDFIDTEIVAMQLTGMCYPGGIEVTVNVSSEQASTGQIVEQANEQQGVLEFKANSFFDVYFEIDTPVGTLHNQEALRLECKIQGIPPYGCLYEPDVGTVALFSGNKEVATLHHAAHIPIDPKEELLIFKNRRKEDVTPEPTPDKFYSITVLKLNADGNQPLTGWEFNLFAGDCLSPDFVESGVTGGDGMTTFGGLPPGLYSIDEKERVGWNTVPPDSLCQEVEVPGTAGAVAGLPACPIQPDEPFPQPGCDSFDSGARVIVTFNDGGISFPVTLNGPTQIARPNKPADVDGLDQIETEIVSMELSGGGVSVSLAPEPLSTGAITEQENGQPGTLEFPADSFFDIYLEVEINGTTLHNEEPFHMECKIEEMPPIGCFYQPPIAQPIDLLDEDGEKVAKIEHAIHIPLPPKKQLVVFTNERKDDVPKSSAVMSVVIDTTPDKECTGEKGVQPKMIDRAGAVIDVCIEINAVSDGGYSGWDIVLAYDDDSWELDQEQAPAIFGPCDVYSGGVKEHEQDDGVAGNAAFGCQSEVATDRLGPIAAVTFISKKKGNVAPSKQDFVLLPKGSVEPRGAFDITGSAVFCEDAVRGKHNCDNLTLEDASILVNPQPTPTPTAKPDPDPGQKLIVPLSFVRLGNDPTTLERWTAEQIEFLLEGDADSPGVNDVWNPGGERPEPKDGAADPDIEFTWPQEPNFHDIADPVKSHGEDGDVRDPRVFKEVQPEMDEMDWVCRNAHANARSDAEKQKYFPIVLVQHFLDNDGEKTDLLGITEVHLPQNKGKCVLISVQAKTNPLVLAHELGHVLCLNHRADSEQDNNLMEETKDPANVSLNEGQAAIARGCVGSVRQNLQTPPAPKKPTETPTATATVPPTETPTATATREPTATETPLGTAGDGDVNKDGVTDSRDALLVLQHVVFLLPTLPNRDRADVNLDGVVDVLDALLMLQLDAGLLLGLPLSPAGLSGALGEAWGRLW